MYPEVETFSAALAAAEKELGTARAGLPRHGVADREDCPGCVAENPLFAAFNAATKDAWDALEASADPLVRWIAANCRAYDRQARTVLEALPAGMAELDTLARKRGWCQDWDDFKDKARTAGVLPSETVEVSA